MELVSKRNFVILLAAILVVGFGLMSLYLSNKPYDKQTVQNNYEQVPMSSSDDVEEIEADFSNTDIDAMDRDLQNMENELQSF